MRIYAWNASNGSSNDFVASRCRLHASLSGGEIIASRRQADCEQMLRSRPHSDMSVTYSSQVVPGRPGSSGRTRSLCNKQAILPVLLRGSDSPVPPWEWRGGGGGGGGAA